VLWAPEPAALPKAIARHIVAGDCFFLLSFSKALLAQSVGFFAPSRLPLEGKLSPQATDEVGYP